MASTSVSATAPGTDEMAVAQHRVAVAEAENFLEPVSDEDDRQALGLQRPDDAGEVGDFRFAQRRGRLVHHDELGAHRKRAGDLDQLLLGDREVAHVRHRVALKPDLVGDRAGVFGEAPPAHEQPRARFAADEHVLGDRHVGGEGEFLIDRDDAGALGVVRRSEGDRFAIELDFARIGALRAGKDLEQGRLAGAVLAEQRVNLRRPDVEVSILERQHARKALADPDHPENRAIGLCRSGRKRRGRVDHSGSLAGEEGERRWRAANGAPSRGLAATSLR